MNSSNSSASSTPPAPLMFMATLSGASEVPPTPSMGSGSVMLMLDEASKKATITGSFSGVQATAAHIHGPAAKNANAPVIIPLTINGNTLSGSATLTDAQIADLKAGLWYANVHSAAFPGGEIRGQLEKQ
ncbi:MAG: CHRD domain-containing protein [Thermaceae bacterium]|nr:CHRD domain-containing protein [Thermaceae bacterium]